LNLLLDQNKLNYYIYVITSLLGRKLQVKKSKKCFSQKKMLVLQGERK